MEREQDLYPPIKALLERQGYNVKGEVGAADVVAVRADEPPVIVELKLRFSLSLFHQAIARLAITDMVYIAVPKPTGKSARRMLKDNLALCRRLGLGLITVRGDARVEVHCDPGPYAPRKSKLRSARLLREFDRLSGDHQCRRGNTARDCHRLSSGCAALRCASRAKWSLQRGCGGCGHRRSPSDADYARQPLWLVREGGQRHLRPDRCRLKRAGALGL